MYFGLLCVFMIYNNGHCYPQDPQVHPIWDTTPAASQTEPSIAAEPVPDPRGRCGSDRHDLPARSTYQGLGAPGFEKGVALLIIPGGCKRPPPPMVLTHPHILAALRISCGLKIHDLGWPHFQVQTSMASPSGSLPGPRKASGFGDISS